MNKTEINDLRNHAMIDVEEALRQIDQKWNKHTPATGLDYVMFVLREAHAMGKAEGLAEAARSQRGEGMKSMIDSEVLAKLDGEWALTGTSFLSDEYTTFIAQRAYQIALEDAAGVCERKEKELDEVGKKDEALGCHVAKCAIRALMGEEE
jgi:hypothetical protein